MRQNQSKFPEPCYNSPSIARTPPSTDSNPPPETETEALFGGERRETDTVRRKREEKALAAADADGQHPPSSNHKPREPNPLWDKVAERWFPTGVPTGQRSRIGKIVRDLKEMGATPELIDGAYLAHEREWPGLSVTPESLVKHWGKLGAGAKKPRSLAQQILDALPPD